MARRARKASGKPPVGLLPELNIPGLEKWSSRSTTPKTVIGEEEALEAIRRSVLDHDITGRRKAKEQAAALGIHPHRIEMADLANVDDAAEGSRPDPWLR